MNKTCDVYVQLYVPMRTRTPSKIETTQRQDFKTVPALDVVDDYGLRLLHSVETSTSKINE